MKTEKVILPPLLDWQLLFLVYVAGIFFYALPLAALCGLVLLRLLTWPRMKTVPGLLAWLACFVLGFVAAWWPPAPDVVTPNWMLDRERVTVEAKVVSVETRLDQRVSVVLDEVTCFAPDGETVALPGRLLWTLEQPVRTPLAGRTVRAVLSVRPVRGFANPGLFDLTFHRQRQGILYQAFSRAGTQPILSLGPEPAGPLGKLSEYSAARRGQLRDKTLQALSERPAGDQGAALIMALVFGDRYFLDQDFYEVVSRASLAHTLALSGLHLGLVVAMAAAIVWLLSHIFPGINLRLPRPKFVVVLAAPMVLAFLWLAQGSPSLYRAALMFACFGLMLVLNRSKVLLDGLFLALVIMLVLSPRSAYELSLQLSAVAVAAVAVSLHFLPRVHKFLGKLLGRARPSIARRFGRIVLFGAVDIALISLAVSLAIMPLEIWYFNRLSPNLLFNVLWLPVLGLVVMPLSLLGVAMQALPVPEAVSAAVLNLAAGVLDLFASFMKYMDELGLVRIIAAQRPGWPSWLGYWLIWLVILGLFGRRKKIGPLFSRQSLALLSLGLLLLLLPHLAAGLAQSKQELRVRLLDVGGGQAIVIDTPLGRRLLVDGGGLAMSSFDIGQAIVAPFITWKRPPHLDYLIYTHPDADHLAGLVYPLAALRVGRLAGNGYLPEGQLGQDFAQAVDRSGLSLETWRAGQEIAIEPGLVIQVLSPEAGRQYKDANEASLVMRLLWQGRPLLLITGDIGAKALRQLRQSGADLSAQTLILPHHGSKGSWDEDFYRQVGPDLALASAGYLNRWKHPSAKVRASLDEQGIPLLSTSERGSILLVWEKAQGRPRVETCLE